MQLISKHGHNKSGKLAGGSATTLREYSDFSAIISESWQGPRERDHPCSVRSTPRLREPSLSPRTITSTTSSSWSPVPSPSAPNINRSLSCTRSLTGRNMPQNLVSGESGGGSVRYSVERWRRSAGGCATTCVKEGENPGWHSSGRRGEGEMTWTTRREGPSEI